MKLHEKYDTNGTIGAELLSMDLETEQTNKPGTTNQMHYGVASKLEDLVTSNVWDKMTAEVRSRTDGLIESFTVYDYTLSPNKPALTEKYNSDMTYDNAVEVMYDILEEYYDRYVDN